MAAADQTIVRARLDNGLEVLLKEVHIAPVASCYLWYRVGSRNEPPDLTGLSHWVEHMQFKGTPAYPAGVPDRLISRIGGEWNASTWLDWTYYDTFLPAGNIDLALKLEADRMVHSTFDFEAVESERTVIISERQGHENSPSFRLIEAVQRTAFEHHPYRHEVIGELADLQHITRQDLYDHYRRFYAPSNAVLSIAGHFQAAEMLERVTDVFGPVPNGTVAENVLPVEPPMDGERQVTVTGPGETELLYVAYRAPSATDPDFLPFAMLNSILAGASSLIGVGGVLSNKTSRLHLALVEGGLAVGLGATLSATLDPFLYHVGMTVRSDRKVEAVLTALDDEMARLKDEPITQFELKKAVKQAKALLAYGSETSFRLAYAMGYTAIYPEIDWLQDPLTQLADVTVEQIMEVVHKYLQPTNRTVGIYRPDNGAH